MTDAGAPEGLLFDLDGTLVDTAPDLAAATNRLRAHHGLEPLPFETLRRRVSHGGSALVTLALTFEVDHPEHAAARDFLLAEYARAVAVDSCVFPGLETLIEHWVAEGKAWGIVTNKPRQYAVPLLEALALDPNVLICADDLPMRKPDPTPLRVAAERIGVSPSMCWYVGDHRRDMEAARAAGMTAVAVSYGYIDEGDDPGEWPADIWFETPEALSRALSRDSTLAHQTSTT